MEKERITTGAAAFLVATSILAHNIVLGFPHALEQDTWIGLLMSALWVTPLFLIYARLIVLMPELDFFEMLQAVFGRWVGRVLCFLFAFYCMHVGALTLGNYAEFIHLVSLIETPNIIISILLFCSVVYLAKSGVTTLGKWISIVMIMSIVSLICFTSLAAPFIDLRNFQPVMGTGIRNVFENSFKLVILPFGDVVILLPLLSGLVKKQDAKKVFLGGGLLALAFLVIIFIRTCGILGIHPLNSMYFPSYKAISVIHVGTFLSRFEVILAIIFTLNAIAKIAPCVLSSARGVAGAFGLPAYKPLVAPFGFLMVAFATILFHNIIEMFDFIYVYLIYALPFQIFLPVLLWIVAEVKALRAPAAPPPAPAGEGVPAPPPG